MPRAKALAAADNIALRLRRRRDGSLALTDAEGRVAAEGRVFPSEHVFTPLTLAELAGAGVIRLEGDTITVALCNASATYEITERRANGEMVATLTAAELVDAPPIDEKKAEQIAAKRARAIAAEQEG